MSASIELKNIEIKEYCILDKQSGLIRFIDEKSTTDYSGLYFRDSNQFFALYPTKTGPKVYYQGNEYDIHKDLNISLEERGREKKFMIQDYNIEIEYLESPYVGMDIWSDEVEVDLFCLITEHYRSDEFYARHTSI